MAQDGEEEKVKLLYGTGNPAKLEMMRRALAGLNEQGRFVELTGLSDMERKAPAVPEDGRTPLENARQKAHAYYDFYGIPVFSCDSGLYFEGLPDGIQPGVHVRTVDGKYLTDQEMQTYYSGLAKRYGSLKARYWNGICLILDREHIYESMDESLASEAFLIVETPCSKVMHRGFPLDSISVDIRTGKYFYEMEAQRADQLAGEEGFRGFFGKLLAEGKLGGNAGCTL